MADCIINLVVGKLKDYAQKEVEVLAEMGDKIMLLNDRLEWLQMFVRDADQKRRSKENPFVAVWVRQTRDVAFEMEDVLDDYFHETFLAEMERSCGDACFKLFTNPLGQIFMIDDLTKRMKSIEQRLDGISNNKDRSNIQSVGEPSSVWTSSSTTNLTAWDNLEEVMVGFDDYETRLKKMLIGPSTDSLKIISIVGNSGLGKRKLARKIFNCEDVQNHFVLRSWDRLPLKCRVTDILAEIHKNVETQLPNKKKTNRYKITDITHSLMDELDEGRYLVVLEGIASITDWNSIKAALPDLKNGSRVLIIMPSDREGAENFADFSLNKLEIKPLDDEGSTNLFLSRVFQKDKYPSWFNTTSDVNDVFALTQGVPLAIIILAGLMRSKESEIEWRNVFKRLQDVKGVNALGRILAMSFDDLPHSLKSCFLYLSAFSETKLHNGQKLVRLWIAEGFIKPKNGRTLEEIGQQYLKELISRCLVELVSKDAHGEVEFVSVHSQVHAFVRSEAQDVNFFEIHDNVDVIAPSTVRRLRVQNHTDKYELLRHSFPKLRSLICENEENTNTTPPQTNQKKLHTLRFLHASKFLRVIDLQGILLESLPNEVGTMIHLRYLGVKNCGLKQLPASIGDLIYLQTFDIQDPVEIIVGEKFWDIPTLRHIFARKIKPPKSLKAKDNLQTLHGVDCTDWDPEHLEKIVYLRSLEVEGLSNSHSERLLAALKKLELLVHLKLKCSEGASIPWDIFDISVLRRLQSLEIDGRIEKSQPQESTHNNVALPNNVASKNNVALPNLTKLILRNTKMYKAFIFMLANFPRLSYLELEDSSSYPEENKILNFSENSFQSLTELHLNLSKLEEWRIEKSAMPKLAKLYFSSCSEMATIPDGLKDLRGLKEVMVYDCPKIGPSIDDKQGQEYEKIKHVPIIHVRWKAEAAQTN